MSYLHMYINYGIYYYYLCIITLFDNVINFSQLTIFKYIIFYLFYY